LQKNNIREWTTPEIIDNISNVMNKNKNTKIFKILSNGERLVLSSASIETVTSGHLKALQVFNGPSGLRPELIVHDYSEDEEKIYTFEGNHQRLIEMSNPLSHRVKALTGLTRFYIGKAVAFKIHRIRFLYYVDQFSDPWLAGFSEVFVEKTEKISKSLKKNFSRSYSKIPTSQISKEWRMFSKGTPIVRGQPVVANDSLKVNKSLQKVGKEMNSTLYPGLSDSLKTFPIEKELYGDPCHGDFCSLKSIKIPKFDESLRCKVPFYLIEKGQKNTNSPFIHLSLLRLPKKLLNLQEKSSKLLKKRVFHTKKVPVCLKCFIVYYNIKNKQ
jgi:hypothetical protein